jgi:hypothetical protein
VHAPVDAAFHELGPLQNLEVLRHTVLGHGEGFAHVTHSQLARFPQQRDHLAARWIRETVKHAV